MDSVDPLVTSLCACWLVFAAAAPATYIAGASSLHRTLNAPRTLPLARFGWGWGACGGVRTLVFQTLSLATWTLGSAVALPIFFHAHIAIPDLTMELLAGAAAVGAVSSQLFQISALLCFDPKAKPLRIWAGLQQGQADVMWDVGKLPSRATASYIAIAMAVLWVGLGAALLHLGSEVLQDSSTRLAYLGMAAACLTMAAFITHGLAGHLRYVPLWTGPHPTPSDPNGGSGSDDDVLAPDTGPIAAVVPPLAAWRFFQPFRGGSWFVATQALGWALYSSGLVLMLYLISQGAAGVVGGLREYAWAAGAIMITAQMVLAVSLVLFRGPQRTMLLVRQLSLTLAEESKPRHVRHRLANMLTMVILYVPMHVTFAALSVYFFFLPPYIALTLLVATLFVYYSVTSLGGAPEVTGRRTWPAFQAWFGEQLEEVLPAWLGSLQVVREGPPELYSPDRKYVFGYAAHGLYPVGAGYLPVLPSFKRLLPGLHPVTLIASVCLAVPIMRDILSWLGLRVVTRRSFLRAVRERGSVLLVPGGQAELVHTHRLTRRGEYCLYRGHKGFVRLALQSQACLVPIMALGEVNSLGNLVDLPAMLQWTYKRLGFPLPYLVVGRWKLSPFPLQTGLKFIIGEPIEPPELETGKEPTQQQIDAVHAAFYAALEEMWAKHGPSFPGYEHVKLVMGASNIALEAWAALQHVYGLGVLETPLLRSEHLEEACFGCRVHLKLETRQVTGSFKARGAAHAMAALAGAGRVVTASTGNHAMGTLAAARALAARPGAPALTPVVYLPTTVDSGKAEKLRGMGAELRYAGADCSDTEAAARAAATAEGWPYLSPYNDVKVAGGQGTIAFELLMALPRLNVVYVPVGGGGLVSGIASVLKAMDPSIRVVGCQPAASAVMSASVQAGELLQGLPCGDTLSGATAGGVEAGSITWPACRDLVHEWVEVSEEEIGAAMVDLASWHAVQAEGAAALAVAGFLRHAPDMRDQSVAVVLSGGNVTPELVQAAHALARRRGARAA